MIQRLDNLRLPIALLDETRRLVKLAHLWRAAKAWGLRQGYVYESGCPQGPTPPF